MTEHNTFFQEVQEELERRKLENIWKRYGAWIIVGAITIIIATAGYTAWASWRTDMQQKQTDGLVAINVDASLAKPEAKAAALQNYADKNRGISQATLAQLQAAALLTKSGEDTKAIALYDAVAADPKADNAFRQLADLFSVQVQMDTGDPVALQKRLQPLLAENAPFRQSAMEFTAFLALRAGDKDTATKYFNELAQNKEVPPSLGQRAMDMARYLNE